MAVTDALVQRMIRASKLDAQLYEEVEADPKTMSQALLVVVLSSVAAGLATLNEGGFLGLVFGTVAALVSWYVWAFVSYFIGTKLLPEPQTKADHGELLRTLGFASAPGIIRIVGIVPALQGLAFLVAAVWMLIATVVAVRQALDYQSTGRAVGVCAIGWALQLVVFFLLVNIMDVQPAGEPPAG